MAAELSTTFTGLRFENPFLLASAPPTESDSNIMRAFDAGWGGVVTKTIGLHPVVNVAGPKTKFLRAIARCSSIVDAEAARDGAPLVLELGAHLRQAARLVGAAHLADQEGASRRASWSRRSWRARAATRSFATGRRSPPRARTRAPTRWSSIFRARTWTARTWDPTSARIRGSSRSSTQAVADVARVPIWAKLTPSTTDIVLEAGGAFLGGAAAVTSSNTFPSLPLIDPETLEFEMNVDGLVSSGGLGGPAILPLSMAKMAQLTQALPRQVVLRHRRHRGVRARAQLLPARLRHGAGVHGGDARSRDRPERHQGAARRNARHDGAARLDDASRSSAVAARSCRRPLAHPSSGRQGVSRRIRSRRIRGTLDPDTLAPQSARDDKER